jgi:Ubiquitin carboxyl-terminal hydrolase
MRMKDVLWLSLMWLSALRIMVCWVVTPASKRSKLRPSLQDVLFQAQAAIEPAKLVPSQMLAACVAYLPSLRRNAQEDAHEFLHLVLDVLDRVVLHPDRAQCTLSDVPLLAAAGAAAATNAPATRRATARRSLAAFTFGGELQSDITCECGNVSSRREPFMDLSVDVAMRGAGGAGDLARADSALPDDSTTRARRRLACVLAIAAKAHRQGASACALQVGIEQPHGDA